MNKTYKFGTSLLFMIGALTINSSSYAMCDMTRAIYTDMNGSGFELRFNAPPQNTAVLFATVTLWHPQRGNINTFDVGSSQGFGTVYLAPKSDIESETDYRISAYFFDTNFKETNEEGASPYMFIAGLGSWDWYDSQMSGGRDVILRNPMWKLDRCR
ncbi:MAG: hypothetical protein AB4063_19675 [Crocosphaera sp.]